MIFHGWRSVVVNVIFFFGGNMSVLEILDDNLMVENLQADSKIDALSKMTDILLEHN